ncbi:hypothetical protein F5Y03DRAFT_392147 [Xylaria venustula]|nr:hypothetical protein F5Y03DRAFT_392147 [Xylaria venustula]
MRPQTLISFAPLVLATKAPRTQAVIWTDKGLLESILSTCPSGFQICEYGGCVRDEDVCCNDGTGEYCDPGYYCVPGYCCPDGEICDSDDSDDQCDSPEVPCGAYCMPATGTCCSTEGEYCPNFGICMSDGTCCNAGDDCKGSGSSPDTTPTFQTPSASGSSYGGTNYTTSISPKTTSTTQAGSSAEFTVAAGTTTGGLGFGFSGPATSQSKSSTGTTQRPTTVAITVTATPSSSPGQPESSGGRHAANSWIVIGYAVAVGLLIQQS